MSEEPNNKPSKRKALLSRLLTIMLVLFPVSYVIFALVVDNWFPFATDEESLRHISEWLGLLAGGIGIVFCISLLPLQGWRGFARLFPLFSTGAFVVILGVGIRSWQNHPFGSLVFFSFLYALGWGLAVTALLMGIGWLCCWRNFKKFLFGCACLITVIALLYAEENWRGRRAWENYKHEWEAKGEQFNYVSFMPPAVPDEQNFAMQPIWVDCIKYECGSNVCKQWYGVDLSESVRTNLVDRLQWEIDKEKLLPAPKTGQWAKGTLTDLKAWQDYYRVLASKTNELDVSSKIPPLWPISREQLENRTNGFSVPATPQTPAQDVLFALGKFDSDIEELRTASKLPYARFPVFNDIDHPFETLLPHLAVTKKCSVALELRAIAELQNSETEKALSDVVLSLRVMNSMSDEPYLISQLVRVAELHITLQPVYEGLANHQWPDDQLARLDDELARLNFLADYQWSMRGERALTILALDAMRRTGAMEILDPGSRGGRGTLAWLIPGAFFYQNELTIARLEQDYLIPSVDATNLIVSPARVRKLDGQAMGDIRHDWWPYKIIARMVAPAVAPPVKKFVYAQATLELARTAIALERYHLAHGNYPDTLEPLAPQFIAQVPHDVIDGKPLQYHRTDSGSFILYSVGWNGSDDGGRVEYEKGTSPDVNIEKGDWVWEYPKK